MKFIKDNKRYFLVFGILWIVFFIGYAQKKSFSQMECRDVGIQGPKAAKVVIPSINSNEKLYRINNFLNSAKGDYYRISFEIKSNQNSQILTKLISPFEKELEISYFSISKSEYYIPKEVIFQTDGLYRDLVFKKGEKDNSDIYVRNIQLSRLNISSDSQKKLLNSSVFGNTQLEKSQVQQVEEWGDNFLSLRESDTRVGQIFKSEDDFLSGVSLILNNRGEGVGNKYQLELREAREKGGEFALSAKAIASMELTPDSLNKDDKETFFPLTSFLEKGKFYFIGIDNHSVKNNFLNYLEIGGTTNVNAYQDGQAIIQRKQDVKEIGDLFFSLYTYKFNQSQGEIMLTGSRIEDLGDGSGLYVYQTNSEPSDLLDLFYYTKGSIGFNFYEGIISGSPQDNAYYVYKISTPYVFKQVRVNAEQMYYGWYNISLSYSFDNQNWIELPSDDKKAVNSAQKFDRIIEGDYKQKDIYIKVTYDEFDDKEIKLFGLRNFKIYADLEIK